ncbi:hypothetical protein EON81_15025 [bacterium]|nr:MAG: hypothetical protein EON81_15025 [bacterium]
MPQNPYVPSVSRVVSLIDEDVSGSTLNRFSFTCDPAGNQKSVEDAGGARTTYQYDGKNRLTQDVTTGPNAHTYEYSYDWSDNRIASNETGTITTWSYDLANRLTTSLDGAGLTTFTFDANGNLSAVQPSSGGRTTMTYNKENRLSSHLAGGTLRSNVYDVDGLKRLEISPGGTTTLVWDGVSYLQARS